MKYIIYIVVIGLVVFIKPWELIFSSGKGKPMTDSISTSTLAIYEPEIFPINQVVSNNDSELETTRRFDQIIQRFMDKWEIHGASFALMKDDRLIYAKGYGYADVESEIPMDVMHIFRIASVSKLITATAIMKLQEEGKLQLSDFVFGQDGILNDSIFSHIRDPRSKKITVEHLLRHQGGYSLVYGDPMFCPLDIATKMKVDPPADLNTIIRFVLSRRLHFTPGKSSVYSNVGYGILSKVIEKVSGEDYETYIRHHILLPAGCFDMYLGKNYAEDRLPNEVKYYEVSNAEQIPACDGSGKLVYRSNGGNNIEDLYGAGGWVASPSELLRFLAIIDNDPTIPDILSPASIEYMTRKIPHTLPIGWVETNSRGEWIRTGTLAGTSALMKKQRDGYAWVFLTNTSSWKGAHFPRYINTAVQHALNTVAEWPERNLFDLQYSTPEKMLVNR